ncbi:Mago binding protein [Schizosaccharomyces pombe]
METNGSFSGARLVDGKWIIPESRRKDGSVRRERAVKPGYTAPEDIKRYRPGRGNFASLEKQMKKLQLSNEASTSKSIDRPPISELEKEKLERPLTNKKKEKNDHKPESLKHDYDSVGEKRISKDSVKHLDKTYSSINYKKDFKNNFPKTQAPEWRRGAKPLSKTSEPSVYSEKMSKRENKKSINTVDKKTGYKEKE